MKNPGSGNIIRVLIVEDSPVMCKLLTETLNSDPNIIIVGVAHNGKEAVEVVPQLKPDIITMDIHMPIMDGFEATKQIMAYSPTPILIVSTSIFKVEMDKVFKAISYGALDVVNKGDIELLGDGESAKMLIDKIKFLSKIKVIHHPLAKLERTKPEGRMPVDTAVPLEIEEEAPVVQEAPISVEKVKRPTAGRVVGVVASTGGPPALLKVLKKFPKNLPCSILIVQHITSGFVEGLVEWLNEECRIEIKVAADSEEIKPGIVYIAPCDMQMRVTKGGVIQLTDDPPLNGHRPSGDVLLESIAKEYKDKAIGVILTGMGRDGATGIAAIKDAGGKTIAQDEETSVVFGMPKVAIDMNAAQKILPINKIALEIARLLE